MPNCLHLNAHTVMTPCSGGRTRYTTICRDCGAVLHEYEA